MYTLFVGSDKTGLHARGYMINTFRRWFTECILHVKTGSGQRVTPSEPNTAHVVRNFGVIILGMSTLYKWVTHMLNILKKSRKIYFFHKISYIATSSGS